MKTYILPLVLGSILLLAPALAGDGYHGRGYHDGCRGYGMTSWDMNNLDGDENGVVSFEEFSRNQMEKLRSSFDSIDTNKDGVIDAPEWHELRRVHGMASDENS